MAHNKTLNEEKFTAALSDVVWRFHVYDQYGKKETQAIKALAKRVPGYSAEFYKESFELNLQLLVTTIEAVNAAPKTRKPGQAHSAVSDVDTEFVMKQLRATFPVQNDKTLNDHLGLVIYWYYLR